MTGINHALTGIALTRLSTRPEVVLPIAFLSHFILDALPHYGEAHKDRNSLFKTVISVDVVLLIGLLVISIINANYFWIAAALVVMSPDVLKVLSFVTVERFGAREPKQFKYINHATIQWSESRQGILVEIIVAVCLLVVVVM